ncbi:hypothetical protein CAPTEDRAFT_199497 [Capitella teleta]|uniref:Uncharacterized protein n=1 Tax=Capitella teleta TaxID=283909 RepID=R7V6N8_CAPTE|nr:hypothetical protein CAPTEDRAFT_199497 [Capitella teleta]|eukprot:ELU14543.1 hypothetical protein CAPTEDRAFT_199497 [Capitella teleta]
MHSAPPPVVITPTPPNARVPNSHPSSQHPHAAVTALGRSPSITPPPLSPPGLSHGPRSRSPSPRRDIGFSAAVSNICDQAHTIAERDRRPGYARKVDPYYSVSNPHHLYPGRSGKPEDGLNIPGSPQRGRSRSRGRPPLTQQNQVGSPQPSPSPSRSNSREPLYRATSLETRSRTPSPKRAMALDQHAEYYGSSNLTDRSRSPSPGSVTSIRAERAASAAAAAAAAAAKKQSGRKLPQTPQKPSTLNLEAGRGPSAGASGGGGLKSRTEDRMPHVLPSPTIPQPHKSPGSINFPKLNASPTHFPKGSGPPPPVLRQADFSPTVLSPSMPTNDLNMPHQQQQQQQQHPRRTQPRELIEHSPYPPSGILNSSDGAGQGFAGPRDNRFMEQEELRMMHGGRPMPNGYKPGQPPVPPAQGTRDRGSGDMVRAPRPPRRAHRSDSDDEDWC